MISLLLSIIHWTVASKNAKNELLDITETRKIIKKTLNITKNPPICLKNGSYCMIKVRRTISKNDESYGIST